MYTVRDYHRAMDNIRTRPEWARPIDEYMLVGLPVQKAYNLDVPFTIVRKNKACKDCLNYSNYMDPDTMEYLNTRYNSQTDRFIALTRTCVKQTYNIISVRRLVYTHDKKYIVPSCSSVKPVSQRQCKRLLNNVMANIFTD